MIRKEEIRNVDFSTYEGKYDETVNELLTLSPEALTVEQMREYLYGYTFTDAYTMGIFPNEMSMDYWEKSGMGTIDDDEVMDLGEKPEEQNLKGDNEGAKSDDDVGVKSDDRDGVKSDDDEVVKGMLRGFKQARAQEVDDYCILTVQERRILEAIDSTGDGKTPETALCVTDVGQEYEYLRRVFPYPMLKVEKQSLLEGGIDRLQFEPNVFAVECIYFNINRRLEVGYPHRNA